MDCGGDWVVGGFFQSWLGENFGLEGGCDVGGGVGIGCFSSQFVVDVDWVCVDGQYDFVY